MLTFEEYHQIIKDLLNVDVCANDIDNFNRQVLQVELYARNLPLDPCVDNELFVKQSIALGVYQILEVEEIDDGYKVVVYNYLRLKRVLKV